ncbi:MAG: hypothetical protein U0842_14930 [Candidatus Binatia bacterium]
MRSYLVRATSGRLGPKLRQGTTRCPGIYRVSALGQPLPPVAAARLSGTTSTARTAPPKDATLGSDIMIHGDRVSDSCLPIGDDGIEQVYALASAVGIERMTVVVSPLDLRASTCVLRSTASSARRAGCPRCTATSRTLAAYPLASSQELQALP